MNRDRLIADNGFVGSIWFEVCCVLSEACQEGAEDGRCEVGV